MHIILETQWAAGSVGDMAVYPHAKIVGFDIGIANDQHITITVEFGEETGGDWVRGVTGRFRIRLSNAEYTAFVQANGATLQALQGALYETVQAKYPDKAAGSIG